MGVAYNSSIVMDGLVVCLDPANPKSYSGGTTIKNLGSGVADFPVAGEPVHNGNAFVFDGVDDNINLSSMSLSIVSTSSTIGTEFSVFMLVKPSNVTGDYALFGHRVGIGLCFHTRADKVALRLDDSIAATSTTSLQENTWYSVGFTHKSNTASSETKLYVNGVLEASDPLWDGTGFGDNFMWIGYQSRTDYSFNPVGFPGEIGPVYVYDQVLSQEEIERNYAAIRGRMV